MVFFLPAGLTTTEVRLDDIYRMVAHIYREQNAQRSPASTFSHFVEVCGALTGHDRKKKREGFYVTDTLCKAFGGGYFTLMAKLRVRSVEEIVYRKYPYVCPYCRLAPHREDRCKLVRGTRATVDHSQLKEFYRRNQPRRPLAWMTGRICLARSTLATLKSMAEVRLVSLRKSENLPRPSGFSSATQTILQEKLPTFFPILWA